MEDASDPWDWDTARVVREFCTDERSWTPSTDPPKLPNLARLKESLQENEVDGESLLGLASEAADFYSDLGIKAIKHKETIRNAIIQLRRRSRKYKIWNIRRKEEDDDEDEDYHDIAEIMRLDQASRKRKLEEERKDDSGESAYNTPQAVFSEPSTPAASIQDVTPPVSTPMAEQTTTVEPVDIATTTEEEPARKKRRIAPITLSAGVNRDALRNLPQGNLVSELEPEGTSDGLSGAYLGPDVLNRADIIDFHFSAKPLATEDLEFEFHQDSCPIGLRRQRARLLKRHFVKRRHVFRPAKPDMIPGGDDPEHYEVLPAYGESDDEYDSDTWREIQEEEEERKVLQEKPRTDLSAEEKNAMVDRIITEKIAAWQKDKLPALEHKANRTWNKARGQGLRRAIDRENRLISHYQDRLGNYRSKIVNQQWSNEADMRKVEGVLDQTIADLQQSIWVINLLKSPVEPQKLPRKPGKKQPKAGRERLISASDEEILTSESESDDIPLRSFIVEDEPELRDEMMFDAEDAEPVQRTTEAEDEDETPKLATADTQGSEDVLMANGDRTSEETASAQSAESAKRQLDALDRHDSDKSIATNRQTANVREANDTGAIDQVETLDLTLPKTPIKVERSSTPMSRVRSYGAKGKEIIDLVTPKKAHKPSSRLSFSGQKLLQPAPSQKSLGNGAATADMINNLDETIRSAVLSMSQWDEGDLWKGFVLPALRANCLPKLPLKSKAEEDTFYALHFARLFDVFLGRNPQYIRAWFASGYNRFELEDKAEHLSSFVYFLRDQSLYYKFESIPNQPSTPSLSAEREPSTKVSDGIESDVESIDDLMDDRDSSSNNGKRKPGIKRDQAAINLRESDVRRVQEQAERTKALRAKLNLLYDTTASQNMRLIINESKQDDEGFIYVPDNIARHIKDHQISGVRFMWNQIVMDAQVRQGCLLAHTMGLGKTMQIITLLMTIADCAASDDPSISAQIPDGLKQSMTLILAPSGLVNNWLDEFLIWTHGAPHHLGEIFKIDSTYKDHERDDILDSWTTVGGVLLIGYDLFRNMVGKSTGARDKLLQTPSLIIADEAHQLKNPKSKIHQYTGEFRSHIRIALTGSPLANNVQEYYAMINWIATNYLGNSTEFRQVFAIPIEAGLSMDSTRASRRKALVKLRSLKETVAPKVHRRSILALKDELPQKTEFVISVPLTDLQYKAYMLFMNFQQGESETARLFATLSMLALLCNHPACFRDRLLKQDKGGKAQDDGTKDAVLNKRLISQELTLIPKNAMESDMETLSWKIPLFNKILDESIRVGDKVLVFSQSIPTLDYLQSVLNRRKRQYIRLDGSTQISKRQEMVKDFNKNSCDVFLLSTTAGGYGLNITGANRVIIFDFKFNPQHEQQAVGRAYRLGQTKPVFVYRFICGGTFEEKLQSKGVFKLQLASRVVDKKNPTPKAPRFEEMFKRPVEPKQDELSGFEGKDEVLDAVLSSDLRQGIRSIVMADTFEEENLEDEKLTNEEEQEAKQLTQMHQARLTGMPPVLPLPQVESSHRSPPTASSSTDPSTMSNGVQGYLGHDPSLESALPSTTPVPVLAKNLNGEPHPAFQSGTVEPVLGPTTQVRVAPVSGTKTMSPSELNFWDNPNVLKGELGRLFTIGETDTTKKEQKREAAQQIANAFHEQAGQRDRQELAYAKSALTEVAGKSQQFIEAILTQKYNPGQLASLSASDIRQLAAGEHADEVGETPNTHDAGRSPVQSGEQLGAQPVQFHAYRPSAMQPEALPQRQLETHLHDPGRKMANILPKQDRSGQTTPTRNGSSTTPVQRKSHKDGDQAVLQELNAQREARSQGHKLPGWALKAVADQVRSPHSSSASPVPAAVRPAAPGVSPAASITAAPTTSPAAAPVRRAKNPFL
ncbi:snf2 family helicase [Seiridium cupressi]